MEIASIVASFVSLIVGILAGGLAIHFYNKQKDDANRVEVALAAIREQTNALQSISTTFLDRLTKYVTTPSKPPVHPDPSRIVMDTLKGIPEFVQMLRITEVSSTNGITPKEWTRMLVALQCYTAETNFWAGFYLPSAESFDPSNSWHGLIQGVVDRSIADFRHVTSMLEDCDVSCLRGEPVADMRRDTQSNLVGLIGDTAFHFRRIAKRDKTEEAIES
jgi:hypothetical protein